MQRINQRKGQCRFMYEVDREQEILKYLPLVERVANRISIKNTEYEYDDLYNIGVIGLIDAMQKFDSSKKVPFENYAAIRIRGAIIDEVRRHSKISRYKMGNVNSFYQAKQELEQEMKREVTDKEIMKKMGITSSQLGDIYDSIQYLSSVSLESTLYSNNDETVMVQDTLRDSKAPSGEKELMKQERRKELVEAIKRLSEREQLVLRQEAISANIANVNTNGYQEKKLFQSTLKNVQLHNFMGGLKNEQRVDVGNFTFGNQIDGSYLNTQSGSMHETDLKTDFAINGAGYFTVRMNNGQIGYTRNGNFTENRQGQLVTQEGYAVLGANGQAIQANEANPNFMIVSFNNASALQNQGNTIYTSNTAGTQIRSEVVQGMLEGSNTDTAQNMVDLIQTSREFEANQKVLSTANQTLSKAVNELGKI